MVNINESRNDNVESRSRSTKTYCPQGNQKTQVFLCEYILEVFIFEHENILRRYHLLSFFGGFLSLHSSVLIFSKTIETNDWIRLQAKRLPIKTWLESLQLILLMDSRFHYIGLKSYKKLQLSITNIYRDSGIYESPTVLVHAVCARDAVVIPIHRPLPAMCGAEVLFCSIRNSMDAPSYSARFHTWAAFQRRNMI